MILDSSAAVSAILREKGHARLVEAMDGAADLAIGAPTLFETGIVVSGRFDPRGGSLIAEFLEENAVSVIPFDERHSAVANDAFLRYGKGRHPAKLNFGDCMTYATARLADRPLLFIGEDFAKTDIASAFA